MADCPCFLIRDILPSGIKLTRAVPTVCPDCARASAMNWAEGFSTGEETIYIPLEEGHFAVWEREATRLVSHILDDNGLQVLEDTRKHSTLGEHKTVPNNYPIPTSSKNEIPLVIRQWVEDYEERSQLTLVKIWETEHAAVFVRCLKMASALYEAIGEEDVSLPLAVEQIRREVLIGSSLPATPGSATYLLSKINPKHPGLIAPPGPTRGVLVTSVALNRIHWGLKNQQSMKGEMLHLTPFSSPWVPSKLAIDAVRVAAEHKAWWETVPFSDMPVINFRKLNAGAPSGQLKPDAEAHFADPVAMPREKVVQREWEREQKQKGEYANKDMVETRVRKALSRTKNISI